MAICRIEHDGLRELFETGDTASIGADMKPKAILIMDFLDAAANFLDCQGVYKFHGLKGDLKGQFAMSVTANWRITFKFEDDGVAILDLVDYH
ncbi:MAG: type II toxin-antitoxin system RelE/ParE family toxin [Rhodospirillales bacterium]